MRPTCLPAPAGLGCHFFLNGLLEDQVQEYQPRRGLASLQEGGVRSHARSPPLRGATLPRTSRRVIVMSSSLSFLRRSHVAPTLLLHFTRYLRQPVPLRRCHVVPTLLLRCPYVAPTLFLRRSYVIPTSIPHFILFTTPCAPTLLLRCSYVAPTLPLRFSHAVPTLLLRCPDVAPTLFLRCSYIVSTLLLQLICY